MVKTPPTVGGSGGEMLLMTGGSSWKRNGVVAAPSDRVATMGTVEEAPIRPAGIVHCSCELGWSDQMRQKLLLAAGLNPIVRNPEFCWSKNRTPLMVSSKW